MSQAIQPAVRAPSQPESFPALVARTVKILFLERRLPGKCYQWYFSLLNRFGVRTAVIRTKNGYTVKGFTHCFFMFYEVWSKHDYDFADFSLAEGMTAIDIGANQGFFSLYAASKGAHVYAFEPCADNYEILKWNVATNGLQGQVQMFNEAVAGRKGEVNLFVGRDESGGIMSGSASICNANRGGKDAITQPVRATTLDAIFADQKIEKCDFLKMDCEGAEYEILRNTSPSAFDRIDRVSMEAHDHRLEEAASLLRQAGFEILFCATGESGLIKAAKPGLRRATPELTHAK